jgi:hypothetical protein
VVPAFVVDVEVPEALEVVLPAVDVVEVVFALEVYD